MCDPKYLEAIGLMMSEGLSAPLAIKSAYIVDTVVHDQNRSLPLSMDPEYQAAYSKLKKMEKQGGVITHTEDEDDFVVELHSDEEDVSDTSTADGVSEIQKLRSIDEKRKAQAKENSISALPDIHTTRRNHQLMSVYVEGEIGKEMMKEEGGGTFIMPDGTTRNKVGEIAAMLV